MKLHEDTERVVEDFKTVPVFAYYFEITAAFFEYASARREDQLLMVLRHAINLAKQFHDDERAWVSITELLDPRIKLHTVAQAKQTLKEKGFKGEIRQEYRARASWDPKVPGNPDKKISKWRLIEEPQGSLEL